MSKVVTKSDDEIVKGLKFILEPQPESTSLEFQPREVLDRRNYSRAWLQANKPASPYSFREHQLGVKNFRREHLGIVHNYTNYDPINPPVHRLDDAETFNTRFKKLHMGLKSVWNACADIAIRDRRYAETFLSNYTNPIATFTTTMNTGALGLQETIKLFNSNGELISLLEDGTNINQYYVFSVNTWNALEFSNVYSWCFVNGIKIPNEDFQLLNTAFGVKLLVKKTKVPNAFSQISLSVNKIYNNDKKCFIKKAGTRNSSYNLMVKTEQLGQFYHAKYIKVYLKTQTTERTPNSDENKLNTAAQFKTLTPTSQVMKEARSFIEIPDALVRKEMSVDGTSILLSIRLPDGMSANANDEFYVMNTIHYHYHRENFNGTLEYANEFPLVENYEGNIRPIPYSSIEDFDIFLDGYHLEAGVHYTLEKGTIDKPAHIRLFRSVTNSTGTNRVIEIYKNEAVVDDNDVALVRLNRIPDNGLFYANHYTTMPLIPNLGHCFTGGVHHPNKHIESKFRRLMRLKYVNIRNWKNNTKANLEYRMRVVNTTDMNEVIEFMRDNLSEFDLVGEWIGVDRLVSEIYARGYELSEEKLRDARDDILSPYNEYRLSPESDDDGLHHDPNKVDFYVFGTTNRSIPNNNTVLFNAVVNEPYANLNLERRAVVTDSLDRLRTFIKYYHDNNINRPLILDSNVILNKATDTPMNLIGDSLVLDANIKQSKALILDMNYMFSKPYQNPMSNV